MVGSSSATDVYYPGSPSYIADNKHYSSSSQPSKCTLEPRSVEDARQRRRLVYVSTRHESRIFLSDRCQDRYDMLRRGHVRLYDTDGDGPGWGRAKGIFQGGGDNYCIIPRFTLRTFPQGTIWVCPPLEYQ
ncbi:uncharacterized protein EV420DRAFT_253394 [Desarmillaria tabescens]|uniref:Uncharacterized protein n=1 Tax=Armillaria tabescens TaxID=1929756 RepID=A0AA39KHM5_ARMTA|nr:uncharacterized protein EV420DRAFT_253394 [Desarmillaria tabescens]KAK0460136.1 hypothetical protein EV420DRAFT_253394 [Desarmillaria tabescens]